jgi:hypothetical protein
MTQRTRTGIALILLAVAAIAFQQGTTRAWAYADVPAGERILVSPIGLVRASGEEPHAPIAECRWWPRLGDPVLCAPSETGDGMEWVRRAYPLSVIAIYTSVLALFLNALRVPRRLPSLGVLAAAAAASLGVIAIWSLLGHAPLGLGVLAGASLQVTRVGFVAMCVGTGAAAAAALLLAGQRRRPALRLAGPA